MEGKKSKPHAILVFGAPCSGKTTFAEKFANKFNLAFYDLGEIKKKTNFSDEQIRTVLELIAHTKKPVIIEGGLDTEKDRRLIRNIFTNASYDNALIWIQTNVPTIRLRMKSRYKSVAKAKNIYDNSIGGMEAPAEHEHPIILSGKHTFETQVKHVLIGLADVDNG